ncbi:MAG: PKD domain-containing protein [Opitutales bacterium]|nr:PKD domain-containing protein [Opitutales bacterium]
MPLPVDERFAVTATEISSTLDRLTGEVETSVRLELENTGDRPIEPPLHAVFRFSGPGGVLLEAEGGPGSEPYDAWYFDLSDAIGGGLEPGGVIETQFRYRRPAGSGIHYTVELFAEVNRDPLAVLSGPDLEVAGAVLAFDGGESFDPDGGELTYFWEFGDGTTSEEVAPSHFYQLPGVYTVRLRVTDAKGAVDAAVRTVRILPEGDFALARTRVLDGSGQPLGGARVEEISEEGVSEDVADGEGLFIGSGTPGQRWWMFSDEGRLAVWRRVEYVDRSVVLVASPWLAKVPAVSVAVSPLEGMMIGSEAAGARLDFPAGAFSENATAGFTPLGGQTLPLPLPRGWTPLAAFHFSTAAEVLAPGAVTWHPARIPGTGETTVILRFDETDPQWTVAAVSTNGTLPGAEVEATGVHVLAVADTGPTAPPAPETGAALAGGDTGDGTQLTAEGAFDPPQRVASLDPAAVTTTGRVVFEADGSMASGRLFRAEVSERYALVDGSGLRTPDYDMTFFGFRDQAEREPNRLRAEFLFRPSLLLPSSELAEARLFATVLDAEAFAGAILDPAGGLLSTDFVSLAVPPGAFPQRTVAELRDLDADGFSAILGDLAPLRAFQLIGPSAEATLPVEISGVPANARFVLARLFSAGGRQGLEPVLRMKSDAGGTARGDEPDSGPRLPGLRTGGRYVLVAVEERPGLVTGTARDLGGDPATGLVAGIVGEPWRALSGAGGVFFLVAPAGEGTADAVDPSDANRGTADFVLEPDGAAVATVDIRIVPTGPRVIEVVPAPGATNVNPVAPVRIVFSEPVDPATFGPEAFALREAGGDGDEVVPGSLGLNAAGTEATFLPTNPLPRATVFEIALSPEIRDLGGLPIEGDLVFVFQTRAHAARGIGAELVIFEPGAENVPEAVLSQLTGYSAGTGSPHVIATGGPGTADPEVPVILVNETTGETATVLSRPDGSFASFIDADEADFVSAVFVNANETRVTIPATRQHFDDGRVGLYNQGGILEAESDGSGVRVLVEPEAIQSRTRFSLAFLDLNEFLDMVGGVEPLDGKVIAAVNYAEELEGISKAAAVSVDVDPGALGLPPDADPYEATYALTIPRDIGGTIVYEVVDKMEYVEDAEGNARLETTSPPFMGLLLRQLGKMQEASPYADRLQQARIDKVSLKFPNVKVGGAAGFLIETFAVTLIAAGPNVVISGEVSRREEGAGRGSGEPLAGALVSLKNPLLSPPAGTPDAANIVAAPLLEGQTIATTRENGAYALITSALVIGSIGAQVEARHARFPMQRPSSTAAFIDPRQVTIMRANLEFVVPAGGGVLEDRSDPFLSLSHTPVFPAAGGEATVRMIGVDDVSVAGMGLELLEFRTLVSNEPLPLDRIELEMVSSGQPSPARMIQSWRISASEAGIATLFAMVADGAGNVREVLHKVPFGIPAVADDADAPPRRLAFHWPPDGADGVAPGTPVVLRISRPLPPELLSGPAASGSWLSLPSAFEVLAVEPSLDGREVRIRYRPRGSGDDSRMTVSIMSTVLDQVPGLGGEDFGDDGEDTGGGGYSFSFSFAPEAAAALPGVISSGGGIVAHGRFAYAISRDSSSSGRLVTVDLANPAAPAVPGGSAFTKTLEGRPSALALVPDYALARNANPDFTSDHPVRTYLVVFSGEPLGFKFIYLFEIRPDGSLEQVHRSVISREIANVVKTKWDPPFLSFLELSATTNNQVHLMDLNAFSIAKELTDQNPNALQDAPPFGRPGVDLNNDGDYADPGERNPVPALDARFFGQVFSWAPLDAQERIEDYDADSSFGLLGTVFRSPEGNGLRMLLGGGAGELLPESAVLFFAEPARRLTFLPATRLFVGGGAEDLRDLALVSTSADGSGSGRLLVVDVSVPEAPALLASLELPGGLGAAGSVSRRKDGRLALAMGNGPLLLLSPERLLLDENGDYAEGEFASGAIVGRIEGIGSGIRTFVDDFAGISAVAGGGNNQVRFSGPRLSVVRVPDHAPVTVDGAGSNDLFNMDEAARRAWLGAARAVDVAETLDLDFSGDDLPPPDPASHYYVVVEAPGGLVEGGVLDLVAQSLGPGGRALLPGRRNSLPTLLANERFVGKASLLTIGKYASLIDDLDAFAGINEIVELAKDLKAGVGTYPGGLKAHRMSADPGSSLYNTFVAGPLVLMARPPERFSEEPMTLEEALGRLEAQLPRSYLRASPHFWIGLAPAGQGAGGPGLDPYRAVFTEDFREINFSWLSLIANYAEGGTSGALLNIVRQLIRPLRDGTVDTFLLPGAEYLQPVAFRRNPVVFVPGIAASRLRLEGGEEIWPSLRSLTADGRATLENIVADAGNPRRLDTPGALLSVGPKDVQGGFLRQLAINSGMEVYDSGTRFDAYRLGGNPNWNSLTRQPELFIFPYDWRLDSNDNAILLSEYVDLIQAAIPDAPKVDIIAHSMGGLVSRRMMLEDGNASRIDRLITITSPLLGATKAVSALRTGDFDELGMNIMLPPDVMRRAARRAPALHQLLPNHGYFALGGRPVVEAGWDATLNGLPYGLLEYEDYRKVMDTTYHFDPADPDSLPPVSVANEGLFGSEIGAGPMVDWSGDESDVKFFHFVAGQQKSLTIDRVYLKPTLSSSREVTDVGLSFAGVPFNRPNRFGNASPQTITEGEPLDVTRTFVLDYGFRVERGMGDGTVPLLSQTRGFGSDGLDFNHRDAVMLPIVSASPGKDDDELASHVGVLRNPALVRKVARILDGETIEQPTLEISVDAPDGFERGEQIEFSVEISGATGTGELRVIWDTGDGGRALGREGSTIYRDAGTFTLTCLVAYPSGEGAVASRTVVVANRAPDFKVVRRPRVPAPGETVAFLVVPTAPESSDTITYEWDFGDGRTLPAGPESLVTHSYLRNGTYTVRTVARDRRGAAVTRDIEVTVSVDAALAGFSALSGHDEDPTVPDSAPVDEAASDFVTILAVGHDAEAGSPQVRSDGVQEGSGLLNRVLGGVRDYIGLTVENLSAESVSLKIPRITVAGAVPGTSSATFRSTGRVLSLRMTYNRRDGFTRCFEWEVPTAPGEDVVLTLNWDQIAAIEEDLLADMSEPAAVATSVISCADSRPPGADVFDDEPTVPAYRITSRDVRTEEISGDDPTIEDVTSSRTGAVVDDLRTEGPDFGDRTQPNPGSLVTYFSEEPVPRGSLPAGAALYFNDASGNAAFLTGKILEEPRTVLTEDVAGQLREETFAVINDANQWVIFQEMLLDYDDMWIFEQGSGASLWRGNLRKAVQAFNPATSDRDFELFFPAVKSGFEVMGVGENEEIDYAIEAELDDFRRMAYYGDVMVGDWYFKPPHGVTEDRRDLGPPPDPRDKEVYERFLAAVSYWRYVLPEGVDRTLVSDAERYELITDMRPVVGAPGVFYEFKEEYDAVPDIPKGYLFGGEVPDPITGEITSVFDNPATPAEVIAFILTERARADVGQRRQLLPEVSFFPFRREHFRSGVMSLEKPPPFGDDPLGDAGMGRHLLLLKWVLEGAFLPPFAEFNQNVDDLALRTEAHNNLMRRAEEAFQPEGYEWALYQEFALLDANVPLRAALNESGEPPVASVFSDYFRKHDMKMLKKGSKALLRALLARMTVNESVLGSVRGMTPAAYAANDDYTTFEHWVVDLAREHPGLGVGFDLDELDDLLRAKVGDEHFLAAAAASTENVNERLARAFNAFSSAFQPSTQGAFSAYVNDLMGLGLPAEFRLRRENLDAIQYGFTRADGSFRPGRLPMHNVLTVDMDHRMSYAFTPLIVKRGAGAVGPLTLTMNGPGVTDLTYQNISIPADRSYVEAKPGDTPAQPAFKTTRPVSSIETATYTFTLDGAPPDDWNPGNETQEVDVFFLEFDEPEPGIQFAETRDTKFLYRGFTIPLDQAVEPGMLESFVRAFSPARRAYIASLPPGETATEADLVEADREASLVMKSVLDDKFALNEDVRPRWFTKDDVARMSLEEQAALAHTLNEVGEGEGNITSSCVSTSRFLEDPIKFATPNNDEEEGFLIVFEVPREHPRLHRYLTTSIGPDDSPLKREVNQEEWEVVAYGRVPFIRAWIFQREDPAKFRWATGWHFVEFFEGEVDP